MPFSVCSMPCSIGVKYLPIPFTGFALGLIISMSPGRGLLKFHVPYGNFHVPPKFTAHNVHESVKPCGFNYRSIIVLLETAGRGSTLTLACFN